MKLIRQSGIRIYGEDAAGLLPEVSDEAFWHSISNEIEDYDLYAYDAFPSTLLTLPRILSFAHTRRILTKVQGAEWDMEQFPQYASLLSRAVEAYKTNTSPVFAQEELSVFRDFMVGEIQKGVR